MTEMSYDIFIYFFGCGMWPLTIITGLYPQLLRSRGDGTFFSLLLWNVLTYCLHQTRLML